MSTTTATETAAAGADRAQSPWRVVGASLVGTTLEWYDFFLYGTAAAVVFPKVFFVKADPLTGTLLSFLTYALGFAARPLGGLFFGNLGDRIGRKRALVITLVIMGAATTLIAAVPSYASIGVAAPILLTTLRMIQGFALGGEWGGAVLIVAEQDRGRRGFWASWPQAGAPLGNVLGTGIILLLSQNLSEAAFLSWGWRIGFALSALLMILGLWVRASLHETEAFRQSLARREAARAAAKSPVVEVLQSSWKQLLTAFGARMAENISYYVITAFILVYVVDYLKLPKSFGLDAVLIGSAVEFALIPLFGMLSDRVGRRPVYLAGAIGIGVWTPFFFGMLNSRSYPQAVAAVTIALAFHGLMYAPQAAFFAELFATGVRYSGASIGYQVASIAAGAPAPLIAVAVLQHNGSKTPTLLAIYIGAAALLTFIAVLAARETRASNLVAAADTADTDTAADLDQAASMRQSPISARSASPSTTPSPEPTA
ncbi:MAG TPA: MFS transporter [Actinocrinis sp.]|nr:MFS transporter [Actinocrinis sp.]